MLFVQGLIFICNLMLFKISDKSLDIEICNQE